MRKALFATVAIALTVWMSGCKGRRTADAVDQGVHGPSSPAESGQHGPDAYNRPPYGSDEAKLDSEHQTAGLTPVYTNGKDDVTMEGSGNLAWQGTYEIEKRSKAAETRPDAQAPPEPKTKSHTMQDQSRQ